MLHHFRKTGGKLTLIQLFQNRDIGINKPGHMESPYHIFILLKIHPCLTADRTVYLCKQRRGNLHKINAPQIGSRCKTGDISHHTAAQSDQHILSRNLFLDQKPVNIRHGFKCLILFSRWKHIERKLSADPP